MQLIIDWRELFCLECGRGTLVRTLSEGLLCEAHHCVGCGQGTLHTTHPGRVRAAPYVVRGTKARGCA